MKFARNFTALRKKMHITQEKMAELCGVSRGAIAKWETGNAIPNLYMVDDIAKIFQVTVDELLHDEMETVSDDNEITFLDKLEKIKEDIIAEIRRKDIDSDLYEQYSKYQNFEESDLGEDIPPEAFSCLGAEAAEKGEYSEAIKYFEEALKRGEISVIDSLLSIYDDILDLYTYEKDESKYWEYRLLQARKMQQYGKILENEMRRGRVF